MNLCDIHRMSDVIAKTWQTDKTFTPGEYLQPHPINFYMIRDAWNSCANECTFRWTRVQKSFMHASISIKINCSGLQCFTSISACRRNPFAVMKKVLGAEMYQSWTYWNVSFYHWFFWYFFSRVYINFIKLRNMQDCFNLV